MESDAGFVAGTVNTAESVYSVIVRPDGTGHTVERKWNDLPHEKVIRPPADQASQVSISASVSGSVSDADTTATDGEAAGLNRKRRADDGSEFTVLFVYTPRSCCRIAFNTDTCDTTTCQSAMQAKLALAVTETNAGFVNAQVSTSIRMVYSYMASYDETTGTFDNHLSRLQATADGYMDEVHTLRNTYAADLVSMIAADTTYCGIGYVGANVAVSASYAFTVVSSACASGTYTVGHEFGHK